MTRSNRRAAGHAEQPSAALFDRRTLQATPERGTRAGEDGAKRQRGSTVPMAVEILGHPMALPVTPANEHDRREVSPLAAQGQDVTGMATQCQYLVPRDCDRFCAQGYWGSLRVVEPPDCPGIWIAPQ